ncbi:putative 2OG-Fe(II) oxygenase [Lysobacter niastensis]|uniref:Tetratricopeptide repeat protein n=1 Tax=Lysobacter niastensis TaxID=380629 RepID=A0ABS0B3U7_9GAMM|nr:putative 2OG-Fe(II) oxygenase [Lysobacter niastensis]MBF6023155.1 tetratricopeptide repeat protein [Lysobacter niastensis]
MPADLRQRLARAWTALQQNQPQQARAECEALLHEAPDTFDAWRMLAMARQALGDVGGCRDALERSVALRAGDAAARLDLGTVLLQAGDAAAALPHLRIAMQALPGEARAAFRFATAAFVAGEFDDAVTGFAAATQCDPRWIEAWNNLAAAHGRLQDYPQAIAAARNALQLRPDASAHQALAALLSNLFDRESLQEGLRFAERALQLDPQMADAHRNAAILLRKLGQSQRAQEHALRAVQLAPRDPDNVDTLGEQLLLNGDAAQAVATYERALSSGVVTPELRRQHGIALLHDRQPAAAEHALDAMLQDRPADQRAIAHLGLALAASGDVRGASERLGLHRHVHAIELPAPPGFASADAFHAALAGDIRRHSQQRWEPAGLAARKAYLSGDLLADRTEAIIGFEQRLRETIDAFIARCRESAAARDDLFLRNVPQRYRLHVWATQAAEQGYIDTHIHEDSWLSGAYYVELPAAIRDDDPGHAGWIEFGRPYANLPFWPDALHRVRPHVGTLLLFPSYLFHRTLPYHGAGERISVSFDLAAI